MDDKSLQHAVVEELERRHNRLPITKTFRFRPSLNVNGIPLKDADFRSSGA